MRLRLLVGIGVSLILLALTAVAVRHIIKTNGWGFADRTVYDWLDVLIFPLVITIGVAIIAYWLDTRQSKRDRETEERQRAREQHLEERRAQDVALQAYIGQMGQLLLSEGLRASEEDAEVRAIARSRTLSALATFDAEHKSSVLRFLHEVKLIERENPIVRLGGAGILGSIAGGAANLQGLDLSFTYLGGANLTGVDLSHANLAFATMAGTDLSETQLNGTDLSNADLSDADLRYAVATEADLSNANLTGVDLESVNFWSCSLKEADLSGTNLYSAELAGSIAAKITGEDLRDADLTEANLAEANLRYASITDQQLAQCRCLKGATMPDGSKHD